MCRHVARNPGLSFATGRWFVEVGAGGYPGDCHLNTKNDCTPWKAQEMLDLFKKYNMDIAAISCHTETRCIPIKEQAESTTTILKTPFWRRSFGCWHHCWVAGCLRATVEASRTNWVTCAWPPEYLDIQNSSGKKRLFLTGKDMAALQKTRY